MFKRRESREALGQLAETGANTLSGARIIGGLAIANYIKSNPEYRSWKLALSFGVLACTDIADGKLARWGRRIAGKLESVRRPFNAYIDQVSDKVMITAIWAAIAEQESAKGNKVYSHAFGTAAAVDTVRNTIVTYERVRADIDDIDTRAQSSGKNKAFKQVLVTGAALSPLADTKVGRAIISAGALNSSAESVTSGVELYNGFEDERARREAETPAEVIYLEPEPASYQDAFPLSESLALPPAESPRSLN